MSLKTEYDNLLKNINKTERRLSDLNRDFFNVGAPCCVFCWSAEARLLSNKQESRRKRIDELEVKFGWKPNPPKVYVPKPTPTKLTPLEEWMKKVGS